MSQNGTERQCLPLPVVPVPIPEGWLGHAGRLPPAALSTGPASRDHAFLRGSSAAPLPEAGSLLEGALGWGVSQTCLSQPPQPGPGSRPCAPHAAHIPQVGCEIPLPARSTAIRGGGQAGYAGLSQMLCSSPVGFSARVLRVHTACWPACWLRARLLPNFAPSPRAGRPTLPAWPPRLKASPQPGPPLAGINLFALGRLHILTYFGLFNECFGGRLPSRHGGYT